MCICTIFYIIFSTLFCEQSQQVLKTVPKTTRIGKRLSLAIIANHPPRKCPVSDKSVVDVWSSIYFNNWLYTLGSCELKSCLCDTEFWINSFNHPETKVLLINLHHKSYEIYRNIFLYFKFINWEFINWINWNSKLYCNKSSYNIYNYEIKTIMYDGKNHFTRLNKISHKNH